MNRDRGLAGLWPRRRSALFDITLAVGFATLDALITLGSQDKDWSFVPLPVLAAINALLALALTVRRRYPVAVAAVILLPGFAGIGGLSGLVALYTVAAYGRSRRVTWTFTALSAVSILVQPAPEDMDRLPLWGKGVFSVAAVLSPVLLGLYMGARKELLASLQEKAARLEREQHLLSEKARAEERTRIAREMHDVVANRISVMVVHAGALRAVAQRDPARAVETATVIGEMGRQALDELRHVIGVLRQGETAQPTPALADIRDLVGQSGAAGLPVTLAIEGTERPLPAAVSRTVYRLVQEGLTNVHKHAGDAETQITLRMPPEAIELAVQNAPPKQGPDHALPSGGNGLTGLRERVVALGGTFEAGPRQDGGFAIHARLPLPAGT